MASGVLIFRPAVVRAGVSAADDRKSDRTRRNSSSKWWSPIFGFSSDPDYLNDGEKKSGGAAAADGDMRPERSRFAPAAFTEEKARQLRRMSRDTSSFHEPMYHSAIASRLASDFSDRTAEV
ncbi:uncharacterized protein LOC127239840 [Andrographis paniculata]|uniref:uncharacterized protein LOC127239840 n=1 Tax=Andrographis paniculata TaxID=175694 RepID=UPI0021E6FDEB|nr:uncharacterized protein LOC127239840 [Andrographis paniculata]